MPDIDNSTLRTLIGYAIGDAGFSNLDRYFKNFNDSDHDEYAELIKEWRGERTAHGFYITLMEKYGYTCEEVRRRAARLQMAAAFSSSSPADMAPSEKGIDRLVAALAHLGGCRAVSSSIRTT